MATVTPLSVDALYRRCELNQLPFETTAELPPLDEIIGQERAVEAIQFGIGIHHDGFNLFALGPNGTGKYTAVAQFLNQKAPTETPPDDWCYVNNFDQTHKPQALRLPGGQATILRDKMKRLIEDLLTIIPGAFDSDEYQAQQKTIEEEFKERQTQALEELSEAALTKHIALIRTPSGFAFAPLKEGEVLKPEEFVKLPQQEQQIIENEVKNLQETLQRIMEQVPQWQRERQNKLKQLNHEVARYAITPLLAEMRQTYAEQTAVLTYLDAVEKDIIENFGQFLADTESAESEANGLHSDEGSSKKQTFQRYQVNVMVDHSETQGAPVVYEDKPAYLNLMGRIEHFSQMGNLFTNFTLIKPGSLHRANGGYLILDCRRLLLEPYAWEALKQALRAKQISIESLGQLYSLVSTVTLEPEPIPLNVKVILLGERQLYYLLTQYDPDFGELFKVAADFEDQMARDEGSHLAYAHLIGDLARKENLKHFQKTAVARIIEHSARLSGDASKLTTHMQSISDLLREADYWAEQDAHELVTVVDVQKALDAQLHRAGRIREQIQESMLRETLLIDTDGAQVGQINGLAVYSLGPQNSFGKPSRITARVRLGKGEVIDIERQVEMGGPIHSKGVMILAGFLGARYAGERPFSLSATLVFEQSYGGIDGDSASSAELYALLSALADVPIKQSLAVTGSVNQHGQVQAIGGVNEKIEGFFDLCTARGLSGTQGVLIPQANVRHLMLRQDVIEAVRAGQFAIYPISHIDEGIELLTGIPAGALNNKGNYPPKSINGRVTTRLITFAEKQRAFATPPAKQKKQEKRREGAGNE
ncbi:MAG: AAA family ATPase [Ardenticatenaceae bacterium]|nr:AAA family ATPase [Ardenticatenaceae bacterium]MCB8989234.1 AAA family ATPase [Ardenticatenaceae bacterium]